MKERPILFKGRLVRRILENAKTQTRRIVKWKPREPGLNLGFSGLDVGFYCSDLPSSGWVLRSRDGGGRWNDRTHPIHCPYGAPGDRLWVKETHAAVSEHGDNRALADARAQMPWAGIVYRADPWAETPSRWRPSIFMPRWASRITLEVVSVRVERLKAITEADAIAEGVAEATIDATARDRFAELWKSVNGPDSWEANPHVWVVTFKRIHPKPIGELIAASSVGQALDDVRTRGIDAHLADVEADRGKW